MEPRARHALISYPCVRDFARFSAAIVLGNQLRYWIETFFNFG